ncbi:uncharacterized protein [Nicotiana sylvestris]|uniref:uncharacterized protein n=1 Tax=Nicotiana sylvestris TaxID=4096 RepID=UPI00388CCF32
MRIDADNQQMSRSDERLMKALRMEIGECRSESENIIAGLEAHWARRTEKCNRHLRQLERDQERTIANLKEKVERASEQTRTLGAENRHCHKLLAQMEVEIQQWQNQCLQDSRVMTARNVQIEHLLKEKRQTRGKNPKTTPKLEKGEKKASTVKVEPEEKVETKTVTIVPVRNEVLYVPRGQAAKPQRFEVKRAKPMYAPKGAYVVRGTIQPPRLNEPVVIRRVPQKPMIDPSIVPWNYQRTLVTYKGREVTGEFPENTFIGRYSNTQELNNAPRKRIPPKEPVSVEEAEAFFQKMKMPDYEVVDQLRKCLEQVSMLSLLMRSDEHQKILLKTLNKAYILVETLVEQLERMTGRKKNTARAELERPAKKPHVQEFVETSQEQWAWVDKENDYRATIGKLEKQVRELQFESSLQVAADEGEKKRVSKENEALRAQIQKMKVAAENPARSDRDEKIIASLRQKEQNHVAEKTLEARAQQIGRLLQEKGVIRERIRNIANYIVMKCHICEDMTFATFFAAVMTFVKQIMNDLDRLQRDLAHRPAARPNDVPRAPEALMYS